MLTNLTDVDSTLSTKGLMQRKLFLMKMMIKNERGANKILARKVDEMGREIHTNNYTVRKLASNSPQKNIFWFSWLRLNSIVNSYYK